jgi:hypothetical protein
VKTHSEHEAALHPAYPAAGMISFVSRARS